MKTTAKSNPSTTHAHSTHHGAQEASKPAKDKGQSSRQRALTAMLLITALAFVVLTAPFAVLVTAVDVFKSMPYDKRFRFYYTITSMLLFSNSAFNFFLYVVTSRQFRQAYREIFYKGMRKQPTTRMTNLALSRPSGN